MPTSRPPGAGSRGPIRREPVARPSGYRITDDLRRELLLAQSFTGQTTLQGVIDCAVSDLLKQLRKKPAFRAALEQAPPLRRH